MLERAHDMHHTSQDCFVDGDVDHRWFATSSVNRMNHYARLNEIPSRCVLSSSSKPTQDTTPPPAVLLHESARVAWSTWNNIYSGCTSVFWPLASKWKSSATSMYQVIEVSAAQLGEDVLWLRPLATNDGTLRAFQMFPRCSLMKMSPPFWSPSGSGGALLLLLRRSVFTMFSLASHDFLQVRGGGCPLLVTDAGTSLYRDPFRAIE